MDYTDITKVSVFDFDGTLMDTLEANIGKKIWKEKTGTDWKYKGWWSKPESLDINILPIKPYLNMELKYKEEIKNPNTFVSLCTGRIIKLKNEVNNILNSFNFKFDEVILNGDKKYSGKGLDNDTLSFKIRYLSDLQNRFPNLEVIELWDDRIEHQITLETWAKFQKIKVIYNLVNNL